MPWPPTGATRQGFRLRQNDEDPLALHAGRGADHYPRNGGRPYANHGIATVGGNTDDDHEVFLVDLIRKRRSIKKYLTSITHKIQPDLIGLSAMAWPYDTCVKIAHLLKELRPGVKIAIDGYHATLMHEEIAAAPEAR
jgi:hypothetical protein